MLKLVLLPHTNIFFFPPHAQSAVSLVQLRVKVKTIDRWNLPRESLHPSNNCGCADRRRPLRPVALADPPGSARVTPSIATLLPGFPSGSRQRKHTFDASACFRRDIAASLIPVYSQAVVEGSLVCASTNITSLIF